MGVVLATYSGKWMPWQTRSAGVCVAGLATGSDVVNKHLEVA